MYLCPIKHFTHFVGIWNGRLMPKMSGTCNSSFYTCWSTAAAAATTTTMTTTTTLMVEMCLSVWKISIHWIYYFCCDRLLEKIFCCCLVSIVTRLLTRCLRNGGLISHGDKSFLSALKHPHWPLGPSSFLFSGYQGLTPKESKATGDMNLNTVLYPALSLRIHGAIPSFPHMPLWNGA